MTDIQFQALMAVLGEIRDALVPPPPDPDAPCEHPEDARVDLSTMTGQRWICRICRHEEGLPMR